MLPNIARCLIMRSFCVVRSIPVPPVIDVVIAVIRISLAFRNVSVSLLKRARAASEVCVVQCLAFLELCPREAIACEWAGREFHAVLLPAESCHHSPRLCCADTEVDPLVIHSVHVAHARDRNAINKFTLNRIRSVVFFPCQGCSCYRQRI